MRDSLFINGLRRELHRLGSRKMYIFGMVVVPLFVAAFFLSLLNGGLPERVLTSIVDLDHSSMSRSVGRLLRALQLLGVCWGAGGCVRAPVFARPRGHEFFLRGAWRTPGGGCSPGVLYFDEFHRVDRRSGWARALLSILGRPRAYAGRLAGSAG